MGCASSREQASAEAEAEAADPDSTEALAAETHCEPRRSEASWA